MVSYIFDKLLNSPDVPQRKQEARQWFRGEAEQVTRGQANPTRILSGNRSDMTNRLLPGRMYMFQYDPKFKNKLPYYDTFPLIFVLENDRNGFLGLNLHYLPPVLRARLMDALYDRVISENTQNLQTRLRISYDILKSASQLRFYKPCIKKYLHSNTRSRFLYVNPDKWDVALMLPSARFQKANINKVYRDSRAMVSKRR